MHLGMDSLHAMTHAARRTRLVTLYRNERFPKTLTILGRVFFYPVPSPSDALPPAAYLQLTCC